MTRLSFPEKFVWGVATSSYQIEGAAKEDGRGESIWDRFARVPGKIVDSGNGDVACDHYHLYREDVALMKRLGVRAYRFSIAWPRILPAGRGAVEPRGLDFYSRLVDALLEAGIEPYATLYHWDLPQVLENEGGWAVRTTAEAFVSFAEVVTRRLGDRVRNWITHNEPWCASILGYQRALHAPGIENWTTALEASHHLLLSHGWAVPVVRANVSDAKVGIAVNLNPGEPASPSEADRDACRRFDGFFNRWFLDPLYGRGYPSDMIADYTADGHLPPNGLSVLAAGDLEAIATPCDFLGINYYARTVVRSDRIPEAQNAPRTVHLAPKSQWTEMGWEVWPKGLTDILVRVHQDYAPSRILVTENGASYSTPPGDDGRVPDVERIRYLQGHLVAAQRAIEAGVPLDGYFVWSLLDNFEWERGYTQRFGITWVDYATRQRIAKDSALWYAQVIAEGAVESL
jgi:beta-glucosidase